MSRLLCSSWSSPEDWLGMTDRYEESQLWLQEPRLLLTDRDDRISSSNHSSNSIMLQHSCWGQCSAEDTRAGVLSSDAGDHWWCPRGLATSDRVLGVGARLCDPCPGQPGPARPAPAARPGPRTLHPQQTSWVSPVTRRAARIEDREDRYITQVSGETETRDIPAGILPYFLHFCILLICQYLLSADKHQPQSTKEALVNTAPIEY